VFPGFERSHHLVGVLVMARRDHDKIDARIVEHLPQLGREDLDLVFSREIPALRCIPAHHRLQEEPIAALLHLRYEHGHAEGPGTDESVVQRAGW
jgi:hypothetical protein